MRGGRRTEEETNVGDRSVQEDGEESRIADARRMLRSTKGKRVGGRAKVQGRPEKEETGQECTDECVVLRDRKSVV